MSLFAELAVLFSLFAELLMLKLTAPVGLSEVLQAVNLIAMLTSMVKATAPPTHMSGILRFEGSMRLGRDGKLLEARSTVTLLL